MIRRDELGATPTKPLTAADTAEQCLHCGKPAKSGPFCCDTRKREVLKLRAGEHPAFTGSRSRKGTETPVEVTTGGLLFVGVVIHGGYLDGYGSTEPEVIFDKVIDEEAGTEVEFDAWVEAKLKESPSNDMFARARLVEPIQGEAIAMVVPPRSDES
jgi:hypothetical protein